MDFVEFLEKRLVELEVDRVKAVEAVAVVREKIKDADVKRGTQPGTEHYVKWSTILKGLERDLDKARSVVVAREAEIEQKQKKLVQIQDQAVESAQRGADISKKIMEMSDEELANLTMEDIALLQEYELSLAAMEKENAVPPPAVSAGKPAPPAAAPAQQAPPQSPPHAEPKTTPPSAATAAPATPRRDEPKLAAPSRGHVLSMAVKAFAHDVGNVTLAEVHAVIDGYVSLRDTPNLDPERERLRDALSVAVDKTRKEIARIAMKLDYIEKHPHR
jgi:hypothetical protein